MINKKELAAAVHNSVKKRLSNMGWKYNSNDERFVVETGAKGKDLLIPLIIIVHEQQEVLQVLSKLPFTIPDNKKVEAAITISATNSKILNGSFDFDISTGEITFRLSTGYHGGGLSPEVIQYMVLVTCSTVDFYNDKLFDMATGKITWQEYYDRINKK